MDYNALLQQLEVSFQNFLSLSYIVWVQAERHEHALTKAKLVNQSEKLHFSQGEVETLKQQLDREKATFEKA